LYRTSHHLRPAPFPHPFHPSLPHTQPGTHFLSNLFSWPSFAGALLHQLAAWRRSTREVPSKINQIYQNRLETQRGGFLPCSLSRESLQRCIFRRPKNPCGYPCVDIVAFISILAGSCHKRHKPHAPTPQAPIRNRQTRKVANAKGPNRNTNLT